MQGTTGPFRSIEGKERAGFYSAYLARDRKPKPAGASIDVSSYVKPVRESAHHTADELDVRAADHCDCNRALPGSTQSSVHVPEVDK